MLAGYNAQRLKKIALQRGWPRPILSSGEREVEPPMGTPARADRRYSYADYVSWADDARWELIDGVALAMTPAPTWRHQEVLVNLLVHIRVAVEAAGCRVSVAPLDIRLGPVDVTDDQVFTVLQPDLVVVCDPSKIDARGIKGAPDIVVEVLSPSTSVRDTLEKRAAYERAGVPEYWIVDPDSERVVVLVLEGGRYGEPRSFGRGETLVSERLPALRVDLEGVFESAVSRPTTTP